MEFRKSTLGDLDDIMEIIKDAQDYFASNNINQWRDGYPSRQKIISDINKGDSYLLIEGDTVLATVALLLEKEPSYTNISKGTWLTKNHIPYGVIHRLAVKSSLKGKGLAKIVHDHCEAICKDKGIFTMKIDTNMKNKSMQKTIEKIGYNYCGNIFLENGIENYAYQKIF